MAGKVIELASIGGGRMGKNCSGGCGLAGDDVDVAQFSPGLQEAIMDEAGTLEMSGIRAATSRSQCRAAGGIAKRPPDFASPELQARGFVCSLPPSFSPMRAGANLEGFLARFIPAALNPAKFALGLAAGAGLSAGLTRALTTLTGVAPLVYTTSAAGISVLIHMLARTSFTLGLLSGAVPLLIEQGVTGLVDIVAPPTGGALSGTKDASLSGDKKDLGQLTPASLEEIERLQQRLQRGGSRHVAGTQGTPGSDVAGPGIGSLHGSLFPTAA